MRSRGRGRDGSMLSCTRAGSASAVAGGASGDRLNIGQLGGGGVLRGLLEGGKGLAGVSVTGVDERAGYSLQPAVVILFKFL